MSTEDKRQLCDLRKKYGQPTLFPFENFGLTEKLANEIDSYNEQVTQKNCQANQRESAINQKIEIFIFVIINAVLLFLISLSFSWNLLLLLSPVVWIPVVLLAGVITKQIAERFSFSAPNQHFHESTDKLRLYQQSATDYRRFLLLIEAEKRENDERRKKEFWYSLSGFQFEYEMSKLFSQLGYYAVKTKNTGDGGVDIILTKGQDKTIVQCKAHKNPIGPHEVRDLFGTMHDQNVKHAILINLAGFTSGVRDFSAGKNITLMDINDILELQNTALSR